ncbi:uncharacterized protein FJT64_018660 [Amphibalanus amphitrite]|uniref:Putative treble-clef zinc-finger domain-containing protein n=1 Tax=Amphibalanus amphitrite TaxID=1232801 RepID=A0A6A4X2S1_AMPAM|nr:uncharacterized protein FJT64_018660 [Amphibalanus amphitrite]
MSAPPDREREQKLKSLFSDLGRATMRGVRKCPQCGTLNGTRGNACKNKNCNVKFRDKPPEVKFKSASKLLTGNSQEMLFSVRVRESGPEMRGFVQIADPAQSLGGAAEPPRCHVASCQKWRSRPRDGSDVHCRHITAALQTTNQASPLMLKNSVLSGREDLAGVRQQLWALATETSGPLVQRVSRCYLVVKCRPSRQFPLGYLHAYFSPTASSKTDKDQRFFCPCSSFRHSSTNSESRRCIHVYACLCAFLSTQSLRQEFDYFVKLDERARLKHNSTVPLLSELVEVAEATDTLPVLDVSSVGGAGGDDLCEVEVEVLEESAILQAAGLHGLEYADNPLRVETGEDGALTLQLAGRPTERAPSALQLELHPAPPEPPTDEGARRAAAAADRQTRTGELRSEPRRTFFNALKERIAFGVKKRRLPNHVTTFVRTDVPPLGSFTKFTWHITNILHVKSIFDGPEITLNITRSFQYSSDTGRYTEHVPTEAETTPQPLSHGPYIKPQQYKTVLRVGCISAQQQQPTPFIIEWVPAVLPQSQVGELRLQFQFVHQRNGQLVDPPQLVF